VSDNNLIKWNKYRWAETNINVKENHGLNSNRSQCFLA
jgi:hypothetical protein